MHGLNQILQYNKKIATRLYAINYIIIKQHEPKYRMLTRANAGIEYRQREVEKKIILIK